MSKPNPDPATINQIVTMAQGGIPNDLIAAALDITEKQILDWLSDGKKGKTPELTDFAAAHRKATALAEIDLMTKLRKHAQTDASSAFKLAEMIERKRRHPPE